MHSDRGAQYCPVKFRRLIQEHGMSMSAPGECLDNLVAESLFGHLKGELGVRRLSRFKPEAVRRTINNYMHCYNSERIHSTLNYLTPIEFER